jgi:hypothetical protein
MISWNCCGVNSGPLAYVVLSVDFTRAIVSLCDAFLLFPSIEEIAHPPTSYGAYYSRLIRVIDGDTGAYHNALSNVDNYVYYALSKD